MTALGTPGRRASSPTLPPAGRCRASSTTRGWRQLEAHPSHCRQAARVAAYRAIHHWAGRCGPQGARTMPAPRSSISTLAAKPLDLAFASRRVSTLAAFSLHGSVTHGLPPKRGDAGDVRTSHARTVEVHGPAADLRGLDVHPGGADLRKGVGKVGDRQPVRSLLQRTDRHDPLGRGGQRHADLVRRVDLTPTLVAGSGNDEAALRERAARRNQPHQGIEHPDIRTVPFEPDRVARSTPIPLSARRLTKPGKSKAQRHRYDVALLFTAHWMP